MTPTPRLSLGLLLTAAAGYADAVGFVALGGHYVSFMSGNTTQLGDALTSPSSGLVLLPLSLIVMFFSGSTLGSWLALIGGARWGSSMATGLTLIGFVVTLALWVGGITVAQIMLPLAAGAGAQNAILPSTGSVRLGTTFVTGTLFTAGQDLARAVCRAAPPWRWLQHLLVWASLLAGAAAGGFGYQLAGIGALLAPTLVYVIFLLAFVALRPSSVIR
jgi:uncharacterized membrane protein YoaK (UPF0700 family)